MSQNIHNFDVNLSYRLKVVARGRRFEWNIMREGTCVVVAMRSTVSYASMQEAYTQGSIALNNFDKSSDRITQASQETLA